MPPLWVYRGSDGALLIYNGVTRATRVARLAPGTTIRVEVIRQARVPLVELKSIRRMLRSISRSSGSQVERTEMKGKDYVSFKITIDSEMTIEGAVSSPTPCTDEHSDRFAVLRTAGMLLAQMPTPRSRLVDLSVTPWYDCISRCVRRAFLCGQGCGHRKQWIENRLKELVDTFAVECAGFSTSWLHRRFLVSGRPLGLTPHAPAVP